MAAALFSKLPARIGWDSNPERPLIARNLLIYKDAKNARMGRFHGLRYAAGTRRCELNPGPSRMARTSITFNSRPERSGSARRAFLSVVGLRVLSGSA